MFLSSSRVSGVLKMSSWQQNTEPTEWYWCVTVSACAAIFSPDRHSCGLFEPDHDFSLQSTHGGRQLDGARAPIDVLVEVRKKNPALLDRIEVYVDGGVRRGTDVVKALCLGARGVGLGRPILYAQSAYGAAGVSKALQIMEEEIQMAMRLLGANTVADLKPEMVEVSNPERWVPV